MDAVTATRLRNLEAIVEEQAELIRSMKSRMDSWGINGLDDLDAGHGNQRFAASKIRIDNTGFQWVTTNTDQLGMFWVPTYSTSPWTSVPRGELYGYSVSGTGFYWNLDMYGTNSNANMTWSLGPNDAEFIVNVEGDDDASSSTARIHLYGNTTTGEQFAKIVYAPFGIAQVTSDFVVSLADGYLWYRTDTDKIRARINGATENLATESYVTANAASGYAATMLLMGA